MFDDTTLNIVPMRLVSTQYPYQVCIPPGTEHYPAPYQVCIPPGTG